MSQEKTSEELMKEFGLTLKQLVFCQNFVSKDFFGNGVQSYIEAYGIDVTKPGAYVMAKTGAAENLTKPHLLKFINTLIDEAGLNDAFVDKQLLIAITQNADFGSKVAAVREYNKLKQRITAKIDVTSNGKELRNWTITPITPKE